MLLLEGHVEGKNLKSVGVTRSYGRKTENL
jgi:hypothetical protein